MLRVVAGEIVDLGTEGRNVEELEVPWAVKDSLEFKVTTGESSRVDISVGHEAGQQVRFITVIDSAN